jgi:hypothetical protein
LLVGNPLLVPLPRALDHLIEISKSGRNLIDKRFSYGENRLGLVRAAVVHEQETDGAAPIDDRAEAEKTSCNRSIKRAKIASSL